MTESKFKVGDKVKFIDDSNTIATVTNVENINGVINIHVEWHNGRFGKLEGLCYEEDNSLVLVVEGGFVVVK